MGKWFFVKGKRDWERATSFSGCFRCGGCLFLPVLPHCHPNYDRKQQRTRQNHFTVGQQPLKHRRASLKAEGEGVNPRLFPVYTGGGGVKQSLSLVLGALPGIKGGVFYNKGEKRGIPALTKASRPFTLSPALVQGTVFKRRFPVEMKGRSPKLLRHSLQPD